MRFDVILLPSAEADLDGYTAREQRVILDALAQFLEVDADIETKRRKRLRNNPLAPWALRIGQFRAFYEIGEPGLVRVSAIGHKKHNDLFIRGEKVII